MQSNEPNDAKEFSVLVLMGGPDAEREVSIASGREVAAALRKSGEFDVIEEIIDTPDARDIEAIGGDVIFPVLHGKWGEGGPLQRELDGTGVPYVGSGPETCELIMHKQRTKELMASLGAPTPPSQILERGDTCMIDTPLVLKPIDEGSSVDLRICHSADDVDAGRAALHVRREQLLAEQYIKGREVTIGVLLGDPLPIIEIIPADGVYDYDAKYTRDDTQYIVNPDLPEGMAAQLAAWSRDGCEQAGCRDICRFDFMVDERSAWFLEANTMPGFTTHSLVPMAAAAAGLSMPALCSRLVHAVLARESVGSAAR